MDSYYFPLALMIHQNRRTTLSTSSLHIIVYDLLCIFYNLSLCSIQISLIPYIILLNWIPKYKNLALVCLKVGCNLQTAILILKIIVKEDKSIIIMFVLGSFILIKKRMDFYILFGDFYFYSVGLYSIYTWIVLYF